MNCYGCYKPGVEGYCLSCRKALFNGAKVRHVLDFDPPKPENLSIYQEKTKRLSISGVQLKYSLKLEGKELELTEKGGQYIVKPIPPSTLIAMPAQAPENEHLTMQLASQVFGIKTAANALIYFKDGSPAYITRRFDVKSDGSKYLQEDMAQISGSSRHSRGENFKYEGTYEDIAELIRLHVAAYPPALEDYFRLVLFNYLISNGDAHLKNFSLIQTAMGDYGLSPAYDLMSTVLHTQDETDTALDLFKNDIETAFYKSHGYLGQEAFRLLADRIGLQYKRSRRILTQLLTKEKQVFEMIEQSFLDAAAKERYADNFREKLKRLGMTSEMIGAAINPERPGTDSPATQPIQLVFLDGTVKSGFFEAGPDSEKLEKENKYHFIETVNAVNYKNTMDEQYITIIDSDLLVEVKYPATSN